MSGAGDLPKESTRAFTKETNNVHWEIIDRFGILVQQEPIHYSQPSERNGFKTGDTSHSTAGLVQEA